MSSTIAKTHTQPQTQPQQPEQIQNIPGRRTLKESGKTTVKKALKTSPAKSASAFRTISEVADELRVQQHVLRFWESKFSQIKPLKRGGGRRYYRPEDVELLKNIYHLLYQEGYTIKGVQKLLQSTRGNLTARVGGAAVAESEDAAPAKKDELQAMLNELKSMRNLIG